MTDPHQLAEAIRDACLKAAQTGFEDALMDGLCYEGAVEVALDAVRALNIDAVIQSAALKDKPTGA
jgi:hypothetical protein